MVVWVVVMVVIDQATKIWATHALVQRPISIVGASIEFRLARNPGSAFGGFRGMTPILALAALAVAAFLVRSLRRATDRWVVVGLALVLGGAVGNLVDRVFRSPGVLRGHVVDFVAVGWWPIFNVADMCITVGATCLAGGLVFGTRSEVD